MRPYFRMTTPRGVTTIDDLTITLGAPLFRSRVYLFGVIRIDYSDVTLIEFSKGIGFVEQSPMGSMSLWRHERKIEGTTSGCVVVDTLTFQPRTARKFVAWFIGRVFAHRHAVLRSHLG